MESLEDRPLQERFTVTYVFWVDSRTPMEIKKDGGFLPKGYKAKISKSKSKKKGGKSIKVKEDVSLYNHVKGGTDGFSLDNDGYVSTTSSQSVAEGWVTKFLGGNGYTYKIAAYANLIDCQEILKAYNVFPYEKEFAGLNIIPWEQVMEWASFSTSRGAVTKGVPVANKDFDAAQYGNRAHGGAQKKTSTARKHKKTTSKKKAKTSKNKSTKKAKTKCTAAMKRAGRCATKTKCTAADKKAGKCSHAYSCSMKSNRELAQEYYDLMLQGRAPKSGAKPNSAGKKGTKIRNKSGKRIGA
ncbi:hypothetical protein N0V90_006222 [Kalmusia sp. IMI 367209]|nr:hypothetical protein N0V90_006222 [Kalmusia sp. IMI 367209]